MIVTRLHKLAELIGPDAAPLQGIAHYVIHADLIAALGRTDVQTSIRSMVEAEIAKLPYSPMLFEFEVGTKALWFVRLEEAGDRIHATIATLYSDKLATLSDVRPFITVGADKIAINERADEADGQAACFATALALLLLNTRGVTKDVIETAKLDRHRVASGKPTIGRHTVLRIGTVYTRDGSQWSSGNGNAPRLVYLRAGHAREQAHGERWSRRKMIYIPPTLVNYQPGDEVLTPERTARV